MTQRLPVATLMLFLFAISWCASLPAQTFSLVSGREPVTSLDGLWRFHIGDNPVWASPNFDDSNWRLIRSDESWTRQGYPALNEYAWYRFKVEVPGNDRPLELLLTRIVSGCQIYADGKLIGTAGSAEATRDPVAASQAAIIPLPAAGESMHSIQIAVRVWTYQPIASWLGAGTLGKGNEVGDPALLSSLLQADRIRQAWLYVDEYAYGLFAGLIGLAILTLFLFRPADKEYLWFAVLLLTSPIEVALHLMMNLGTLPFPLWCLLGRIFEAGSITAALAFFSIVLHARRNFLWWAIVCVVAAMPLTAVLIYFQWTGVGIAFAIEGICILPAYLWVIARLLMGALRKDVSARVLLAPVVLYYGVECADFSARIAWQLRSHFFPSVDFYIFERPFPVSLSDVTTFIFLLALLIFLVRRFSLARKEEERLAGEFEAAKTIQALLIPAHPPPTPGFAIENVYLPAQEVGGDFFQVVPGDDGSLLIVVGDVSGKGLKAALTVSAIVGALRGCALRAPAEVLAYLNGALRGQLSGFFTCCAALIGADGTLTVANAGHLAPYLNGKELSVIPGLPLGIADEAEYSEISCQLGLGNRLTFISDGVVEARDAKGELLGFERMTALTSRAAAEIAEAAQRWGQEDDITVLTVARAPKLEAVPA